MGLYFFNSCVVTGLTILFTILFSLMAAYALERMIWKGRKQVNALFMLGLTVPIHAAILPIFIILRKFHMLNSYQSLIVPYVAFALATVSYTHLDVYKRQVKMCTVLPYFAGEQGCPQKQPRFRFDLGHRYFARCFACLLYTSIMKEVPGN